MSLTSEDRQEPPLHEAASTSLTQQDQSGLLSSESKLLLWEGGNGSPQGCAANISMPISPERQFESTRPPGQPLKPQNYHHAADKPVSQQLDPTRQPSATENGYRFWRNWVWELVELVLSSIVLTTIFVILIEFKGQRVPDWGPAINLSTILSLLATMFQASLLACITQIISQSKWSWYSTKPKMLGHLQEFDSASRGGWGAVFMLSRVARGNIVIFAAVCISLLSSAIGPFVQQALGSTECAYVIPEVTASLPLGHFVPRYWDDTEFQMIFSMSAAIPNSLPVEPVCQTGNCTFTNGDPVEGDSNLASYSSIALCHSCLDASSLVAEESCNDPTLHPDATCYTLPNGLRLSYADQSGGTYVNVTTADPTNDLSWARPVLTPEFVHDAQWAFSMLSTLTFSGSVCGRPDSSLPDYTAFCGTGGRPTTDNVTAGVCIVYPCIKTYTASVANNKLLENETNADAVSPDFGPDAPDNATLLSMILGLDSPNNPTAQAYNTSKSLVQNNKYYAYTGVKSPCLVDGKVYTMQNMSQAPNVTVLSLGDTDQHGQSKAKRIAAPELCIYRHDARFGSIMSGLFESVFDSFCSISADLSTGLNCYDGTASQPGWTNRWMGLLYNGGNSSFSVINNYFRSLSVSITSRYRFILGSASFNMTTDNLIVMPGETVSGQVWQTTVCTAVQFEWLLLPCALLLGTISLLLVTMISSWRKHNIQPIWKDSLLPLIFYKERFKPDQDPLDQASPLGGGSSEKEGMIGNDKHLLEAWEMAKMASKVPVTFQWAELASGNRGGDAESSRPRIDTKRGNKDWPGKRKV